MFRLPAFSILLEIIENRKQDEETKKVLKKAKEVRAAANILKITTNIDLDKTKAGQADVAESTKLFERQLDQVAADISKQENIKIALENIMLTN